VQQPIDLGGLFIQNLETVGLALQMIWQWFKKTQAERSWVELELRYCNNTRWHWDEHTVLV
jgi:hypothetical protein